MITIIFLLSVLILVVWVKTVLVANRVEKLNDDTRDTTEELHKKLEELKADYTSSMGSIAGRINGLMRSHELLYGDNLEARNACKFLAKDITEVQYELHALQEEFNAVINTYNKKGE